MKVRVAYLIVINSTTYLILVCDESATQVISKIHKELEKQIHLPLNTLPKHPSPISFKNLSVSLCSIGTELLEQAEYCGFGAYLSGTSTLLFSTIGDGDGLKKS